MGVVQRTIAEQSSSVAQPEREPVASNAMLPRPIAGTARYKVVRRGPVASTSAPASDNDMAK